MRGRTPVAVLTAALLAVVLAGCGDDDEPGPSTADPIQTSWTTDDLVGEWDVEIEGMGSTDVTFTESTAQLAPACGLVEAPWTLAPEGAFSATISTWPDACAYTSADEVAPWLTDAERVESGADDSVLLVGPDGTTLATLTDRVGSPPPSASDDGGGY
jgi:hypothetical protein